jgi:hypothetical protein
MTTDMRLHSTFLILAALFGFLATCIGGPDLQTRLENSLKDARSISNVEMRVIDILWQDKSVGAGGVTKADFSRTFEYSYIRSGQKYRAACKLISATDTNVARLFESTFDGTSYVCYDADRRYMTKSSTYQFGERGECQNSPLVAPFMFLSRQSDDCFSCLLRFADIVAPGFTNGLTLPKGKESSGLLHITVPERPMGKQPTQWSIRIDETGDSLTPKTMSRVMPGFGAEVIYRLLNYTNLGTYRFPITIEWTAKAYPLTASPSLLSTGMTRVISVRMPDRVAGSTFQLDEELAERIWDKDQRRFTKSAPRLPNPSLHSTPQ